MKLLSICGSEFSIETQAINQPFISCIVMATIEGVVEFLALC